MDIEDYRRRTLAEMAAAPPSPPKPDADAALAKLADPAADPGARRDALDDLRALAFHKNSFAPYRPQFLDALAKLVADRQSDFALRAEALERLAAERDPLAAQALKAGLADPKQALLPLAKALQLLAYDDHGEGAKAARTAIAQSDDPDVWTEAMHALAGDPTAAPILEGALADPNRPEQVRLAGAAALHALDPRRLIAAAAKVIGDPAENDTLRADLLTALGSAHQQIGSALDAHLADVARDLQQNAPTQLLRDAAKRLLNPL